MFPLFSPSFHILFDYILLVGSGKKTGGKEGKEAKKKTEKNQKQFSESFSLYVFDVLSMPKFRDEDDLGE